MLTPSVYRTRAGVCPIHATRFPSVARHRSRLLLASAIVLAVASSHSWALSVACRRMSGCCAGCWPRSASRRSRCAGPLCRSSRRPALDCLSSAPATAYLRGPLLQLLLIWLAPGGRRSGPCPTVHRAALPSDCGLALQHDVHAAVGSIEAEKSALKSIVSKYNVSEEDLVGEQPRTCAGLRQRCRRCSFVAACWPAVCRGWPRSKTMSPC